MNDIDTQRARQLRTVDPLIARTVPTVSNFVRTALVRLPGWFTASQALAVARLKKVDHILVEDRGQVRGLADRRALETAPSTDTLARWSLPTEASIDAQAPVSQAMAQLADLGLDCLPVFSGGLLVGTISAADLPIDTNTQRAA